MIENGSKIPNTTRENKTDKNELFQFED